jgi:hypothetical protein
MLILVFSLFFCLTVPGFAKAAPLNLFNDLSLENQISNEIGILEDPFPPQQKAEVIYVLVPLRFSNLKERVQAVVHNGIAYQGDIVLGPIDELEKDPSQSPFGSGYIPAPSLAGYAIGTLDDTSFRWPDGVIPYVIEESVIQKEQIILNAMKTWESQTNIQFVEFDLETAKKIKKRSPLLKGRLQFIKSDVCGSYVGRRPYKKMKEVPGFYQNIFLADGCQEMAILHELGHAIGLFHEQTRPDRDQYIAMQMDNVKKEKKSQYGKGGETDRLVIGQYDFQSIMHYADTNFVITKGTKAFTIREPFINQKSLFIGRTNTLSAGDIESVNKLYPKRKVISQKSEVKRKVHRTKIKNQELLSFLLKSVAPDHPAKGAEVESFSCKKKSYGSTVTAKCTLRLKSSKKKYTSQITLDSTGFPRTLVYIR